MNQWIEQLRDVTPTGMTGTVVESDGSAVAVAGFPAPVGALARIAADGGRALDAEVIGFRDQLTIVSPLGEVLGVRR